MRKYHLTNLIKVVKNVVTQKLKPVNRWLMANNTRHYMSLTAG